MTKLLTQKELKDNLKYYPRLGIFRWRLNKGKVRKGDRAGTYDKEGYYKIRLNYTIYYAHRLAWVYMTGGFPDGAIDHIDGDKWNTKWRNLRLCFSTQNQGNRKYLNKNNTSGYKGVSYNKSNKNWNVWCANKYIGAFPTPKQAANAYDETASVVFGEFAVLNGA